VDHLRASFLGLTAVLPAAALLIAVPGAARAQSAADGAARAALQFQSRQSEQQRLRQLEELQRTSRSPTGDLATPPVAANTEKGGRCFKIRTIKVDGAHLISNKTIRATVSAWEGRCLGLAEINSVLKAVTFLYVERGYIASRAFLQEQNLSKGELSIAIVEGRLDAIRISGEGDGRFVSASAFPGMAGKPVNLRDLEQGLDQLNRLRSNNATVALNAGGAPGDTVVDVTTRPGSRVHVTMGTDTLGATVSGIYQSRLDMALDNVFGVNDLWQFGYLRSSGNSPASSFKERPNSDTVTASMSVPYGYWTFGIDNAWSEYRSSVQGQVSTIDTSGGSLLISPYVTYMIYRDQLSKTWVTGRMTWKDTKNDILGTRIDIASNTLSIASLEVNHSRQILGGQATASFGYQHGLAILGAVNDASALVGSPKGEFTKYVASLGYTRPFNFGPVMPIFSTYLMGQWTPDHLFGTEQLSLGGYASIRGVRDAILFADRGALARNEFSLLLPALGSPDMARLMGRIEPYLAIDVGYAAPNVGDPVGSGGTLVGAAAGVRNRAGRISFDVWYAQLIVKPSMPLASMPPTSLVQGRVSISF